MIRLYLSDDLLKATAGSPPTGGGPKGVSPPKTPGAATGGSGPQIVDCPLGAACPDGGRHEAGSTKLQEHTAQAQRMMQPGQPSGDESAGKESGKPGVPPGAANIGGVGSDQVRKPPAIPQTGSKAAIGENKTNPQKLGAGKIVPQGEKQTGSTNMENKVVADVGLGHKPEAPDERQTLKEFPAQTAHDVGFERPSSENQTLVTPVANPQKKQNVPNPLVADEANVPSNSKPMDHYKLSQIARESGDENLAQFHEGMARKRTEGMGSEDHRKLAEQLHAEGMHEPAKYHAGIHQRVTASEGNKEEITPEQEKKHHDTMIDVHSQARAKASSDLDAAKNKHEETKAKAEKIRASNEDKLKQYETDNAEYEKKKTAAKNAKDKSSVPRVGKPPEKPKLEKEGKVPEKPELFEPKSDAEKLRHEGHTSKAKRLADMAESHLKGNKELTTAQKERLERAHKMAVYHSNVEYTPTAAHKKELGEVEHAISGMGIKGNYEDMATAEDAKKTAEASKQAAKQQAKQDKTQIKEQQNANAQPQAAVPQPPQTDLDHARIAEHKSQAQELRSNIESHMAQNPDMSPEDKAKAERLLNELGKHENIETMPSNNHKSELKELKKLAGEHGKKPYEAEEESAGSKPKRSAGNADRQTLSMINAGRALGSGLAASATSPYGAAGHIAPQIVSYGSSGAIAAGHRLLHDTGSSKDTKDIQEGLDQEKEEQAKRAKQAARQHGGNDVIGRGNQ